MSGKTVVFLCVANSSRSQMAEGLARAKGPAGWRFFSAGSKPAGVHPLAVKAMSEIGIDIGAQRSKGLDQVPIREADVIVTLCAEEVCPVVPGPVSRVHWPIPDPAAVEGTEEARLAAFRAARDEIARRLETLWRGGAG
ncbi:MAG: arsenate reductase (thioredoxin) [Gemmatimonadales bacterium]|nr:Glutaredoxin arsenate reductase [bacterium HR33]GIW51749.1 MAG: arsenate reductase (thioredoxin) [Gemmatimonadales bacterium]